MAALVDLVLLAGAIGLVHWLRWYGPWAAHVEQGVPDYGRLPGDLPFEFEAAPMYASAGVLDRWMPSPWTLRVSVTAPADVRMDIRRERAIHRLLDPLGLSHDATTGWRVLDDALRVGVDQPAVLRAIRESPEFQQRVLALLRIGRDFTLRRIRCRAGVLSAQYRSEADLGDGRAIAASIAEHLHVLADALRAVPESDRAFTAPSTQRAVALRSIAAGLAAFALLRSWSAGWIEGAVSSQPSLFAGTFSTFALVATAALALAALALTRGSTQRSAALLEILTLGLVGSLFTTGFLARDLNVALDRSPPRPVECTVTEKRATRDGYVLFGRNDCTDGSWLGSVGVTASTWERAQPGDRLRVARHSGAFGYAYYRDPELVSEPE